MESKATSHPKTFVKRWAMIIGLFLFVQIVFMLIDGTSLEPNINDSGRLFARIGRWVLNTKLFTEWITPYSYAFFNLCFVVHIAAMLIQFIHDIVSKKHKNFR